MSKIKFFNIFSDFILNIIASLLVVGVLQIAVYPILAKSNTPEMYGLLLTIMAIVNLTIQALGSSLNNVRLIMNREYENNELTGDFNLLLILSVIVSVIPVVFIGFISPDIHILTIILLLFTVGAAVIKTYYLVSYRLILNFKRILICNSIISGGHLLGAVLSIVTDMWPLAFLFGELLGCIYIFYTSPQIREPFIKTKLFNKTFSKFSMLILITLIGNLIVYFDRFIIYPFLGGEAVSTFTVASFFGKSVGLLLTPIAGVLLGYYVQKNFCMTKKTFWSINILTLIISSVFLIVAYFISPWFTGILYPTLIESAKPYILLANIAAILGVTASMIIPAILRVAPMHWQVVEQIVYMIVYIGTALWFLNNFGLLGFCISNIIVNVFRILMLYLIGHISIEKQANNLKMIK